MNHSSLWIKGLYPVSQLNAQFTRRATLTKYFKLFTIIYYYWTARFMKGLCLELQVLLSDKLVTEAVLEANNERDTISLCSYFWVKNVRRRSLHCTLTDKKPDCLTKSTEGSPTDDVNLWLSALVDNIWFIARLQQLGHNRRDVPLCYISNQL